MNTLNSVYGTSTQATVKRILLVFDRATAAEIGAGSTWYSDANRICADMTRNGHSIETCAAIIAHLSPQLQWNRNILAAWAMVNGEARLPGVMNRSWNMAHSARLSSDPLATLNGPKVKSFAANILGDHEAVTLDTWAMRVAGLDYAGLSRSGIYEAVANCYRIAASKRGVEPSTMQAVTWVVMRNGRAQ